MYKDSKDRIYLFRKCGQKVDATKMMFMTEFENELENDFDIEDQWMVVIQVKDH